MQFLGCINVKKNGNYEHIQPQDHELHFALKYSNLNLQYLLRHFILQSLSN